MEWFARITNGVERHLGITWEVIPRSEALSRGFRVFEPALVCITQLSTVSPVISIVSGKLSGNYL
jgi:hypothetical protein